MNSLKVPDWGEDFAEVAWKPSEDDGGADISGYRVEVRNRDRRAWNVAGTAGGSESRYQKLNRFNLKL